MPKARTTYLSYIEETPKHFNVLQKVAKEATHAAIQRAKRKNLSITYLKDNWIVSESSTGVITKVKPIRTSMKKATIGEKFSLR